MLRVWRFRGAAALLIVLGLGGLTGCGSISMPFFGKKAEKPATPACPVAVILHPLANTAIFNVSGGDIKPLNVTWYGIFSDISASCTLSGNTLHASLDNIIVAERGPAVRGNDADFDYFVALTAGNQTILGKKPFAVHVTVPSASKRAGVNDHVEVAFDTGGHPVSDLNITVGFQQSPQAIEFYKHFRGR
jgi:hypothetical protein